MEHVLPLLVNTVLNGLDAIAYGPLLTGNVNGIGLYLISTTIAQAILPMVSSFPYGVTACTMVESIPFMAGMRRIADGNVTTMLLGFSGLTLLTAGGFAGLRVLDLERAVHQFPRVVLLGMMAGVGVFLVLTARNMSITNPAVFNLGFLLACLIVGIERWYRMPFLLPCVTILIVITFYAICLLNHADMEQLRRHGWLPQNVQFDPTFYYSKLSLQEIDLQKLLRMAPIAVGGSLFNLLHVPINVPSLSRFSGLPFRMDRELLAHSAINLATGLLAFAPTYMAYTNSILFLKSGCQEWVTAVWLAAGTGVLVVVFGRVVVWVPSVVACFLICNLAVDLVIESVVVPLRVARAQEWLMIVAIMAMTSRFGFIVGLVTGTVLSCLSLYADKQKVAKSRRQLPQVIVHGAIVDRVTERFAKKFIYTTKLPSHLLFPTSTHTLSTLHSLPPHTLFHIIDFTKVGACDLNVMEGLLCLFGECVEDREFVFVNCEMAQVTRVAGTTRNFPSSKHAEKYCELRLLQRLAEADRRELDGLVEEGRLAEQRLLYSPQREQVEKEAGESVEISSAFLLHLHSGQAQATVQGEHDAIVFLEAGAWILPNQVVTFTATTTGTLIHTATPTPERDTIYTLYTTNF